jgi:hypothetical protein
LALSAFTPVLSLAVISSLHLAPHYKGIAAHPCRR